MLSHIINTKAMFIHQLRHLEHLQELLKTAPYLILLIKQGKTAIQHCYA
jgi:hypothetical protein